MSDIQSPEHARELRDQALEVLRNWNSLPVKPPNPGRIDLRDFSHPSVDAIRALSVSQKEREGLYLKVLNLQLDLGTLEDWER